jgi:hypothetical protein
MATPYSWGFRRGEGNYQYQEFLKRRMEAERQAGFADRIAAEKERISLSQWQPEPDEQEIKIKTKSDGTSTIVTTDKFPSGGLLEDPMGLEGTGTGDWGASLLSGDVTIPQSDIYEYERLNDLYAAPPADMGEVWPEPLPPVDPIIPPEDTRPFNQRDILIPDHFPRHRGGQTFPYEVETEAAVLPEAAVVQQAQDIPGVAYAQGMPVGGWGTGYQQDAPGMERMPAATDEDYRRIYGDQARVMEMRGLLEDEELATQYVDTTGRTAADYGQVRRPPNWALRSVPGYMGGRTGPPTYEEEIPVGPVAGTPEYQALVDSIQASEVIPSDSPIYGDSQALGTVEDARVGVDAAVKQIIPQPQVVQPEPQPQQIAPQADTGMAADQQRLIDESTQKWYDTISPPAVEPPIVTPSLLDQPEVDLSWEDIVGGQAAEVVTPDVADPVERDILKSQSKGYVDPDTGLTPERRPRGVPALKDETATERRIRLRREAIGLDLSDMDMERLGIPEVAGTLNKMYEMEKQAAMVQFANMLKEQQKKKVTKIRGVGRRRQGQQHAQLLNPTPMGMGDQYG